MSLQSAHIVEVVSNASGNGINNLSNDIPRDGRELINRGHYCDVYKAQWRRADVDAGVVTVSHCAALL